MDIPESHILTLVLAVLNREPDAKQVLADLLEEAGHSGAAQWARARKSKIAQRVDFALGVLPARIAAVLTCRCVRRWLKSRFRESTSVTQLVDGVEFWAQGSATEQRVEDLCRQLLHVRANEDLKLELRNETGEPLSWGESPHLLLQTRCLRSLSDGVTLLQRAEQQQGAIWIHEPSAELIRRAAREATHHYPGDLVWKLDTIQRFLRNRLDSVE